MNRKRQCQPGELAVQCMPIAQPCSDLVSLCAYPLRVRRRAASEVASLLALPASAWGPGPSPARPSRSPPTSSSSSLSTGTRPTAHQGKEPLALGTGRCQWHCSGHCHSRSCFFSSPLFGPRGPAQELSRCPACSRGGHCSGLQEVRPCSSSARCLRTPASLFSGLRLGSAPAAGPRTAGILKPSSSEALRAHTPPLTLSLSPPFIALVQLLCGRPGAASDSSGRRE